MLRKILHQILSFADRKFGEMNKGNVKKKNSVPTFPKDDSFIGEDSRQQSMKNSQGKSDFSGSSYNGPGNVDREKRNSNMSQRNY